MARRLRGDEYTIGWVCALPVELIAAQEMLDEEHSKPKSFHKDSNAYTFGRIYEHNVVVASMPSGQTGHVSAAVVASQMRSSFPTIRLFLMVGIGGGVPSESADIRLGDVVVSHPEKGHSGVIQYDFGKSTPNGFEQTGFLNAPPSELLGAIAQLRALQARGRNQLLPNLLKLSKLSEFTRERAGSDMLFERDYDHEGGEDCSLCKRTSQVQRYQRTDQSPFIYFGTIASANQVMRDGKTRDKISAAFKGVLCFEMEAAGLMNWFPCLVIRGICDYADSHKNKTWQPFAAGTAAAYAKELVSVIPTMDISRRHMNDEESSEQASVYCLPFQRNFKFTGRDDELSSLRQKFFLERDCQRIALVGLGGIGKTQVALQFAYSVKQDHPEFSIFWVPALGVESFEQAYLEIARAVGIPQPQDDQTDIKALVKRHLSTNFASKWILIIDNADDIDLMQGNEQAEGLLDFLPGSDLGLILFTTRHYEVGQILAGSDMVEVSSMESQDAIELFKKSLVRKDPVNEDEHAIGLLTELEYLPLAIIQAAAYINVKRISASQYRLLLNSTEQDATLLMNKEFGGNARYEGSENALAKTWLISFQQILKHDTVAVKLLEFISCIEWKSIPYSLLPTVEPTSRMVDAIGTLCSYSFLKKQDIGESFDMHRLVHLATRIWIRQNGRQAETIQSALEHIMEVFPSNDFRNRGKWREYLPHAAYIDRDDNLRDTAERSELCLKVGRCLREDGKIREAVRWLEKSCAWRDGNLPRDDGDRLIALHSVAIAYLANGKVKKAVKILEEVVAIEEKVLAEDHPDRLASQHQLAIAYRANGQVQEAVGILEAVVAIEEKELAKEHPSRLASQHGLAIAYRANGQVQEAVGILEAVVAIREKVLAQDHPDRLASQHELASAYQANGQVQEAVGILEAVVAIREKVLAQDHPDRLASQHGLASAYQANGQVQEAVGILEAVVTIREKVLAQDHPDRLASQHELASAYRANGQVQEAVDILEAVVAIKEKVLAKEHPSRLASQHQLAVAYRANGQVQEAVDILEAVDAVKKKVLAEDHPSRLAS